MKVITVVGARPQFIKTSVVSIAFQEQHPEVEEILVHTGQHYDSGMSDVFFDELGIAEPRYNLGIGGGPHGQNTGRMLEQIESVLIDEQPDWVLVYGDTDSTLAGALAATKLHYPVAHVEAGLRSFNRVMPEEVNRVLTDHIADVLFTPTTGATRNLQSEGIRHDRICQVGDVMFDAVLRFREVAGERSNILEELQLEPGTYVLATLHRAENVDDRSRLTEILIGFRESPMKIVLPLHPRTKNRLSEFGLSLPATVRTIEPVGYLDMMRLQQHAALIATDSGGLQKEAYFHGVSCLTLRDETEWVELVEMGVNRLVGADSQAIAKGLNNRNADPINPSEGLYGNGDAAERIAAQLTAKLR